MFNKVNSKKSGGVEFVLLTIIVIFSALALLSNLKTKKTSASVEKADESMSESVSETMPEQCRQNIILLTNAVNKYNEANKKSPIFNLDNDSINLLLKNEYIKKYPHCPSYPVGKIYDMYAGKDLLTGDCIFCIKHGYLNGDSSPIKNQDND